MGLFDSLANLTDSAVTVVAAPVAIVVDTARIVAAPLAAAATVTSESVRQVADVVTEELKVPSEK